MEMSQISRKKSRLTLLIVVGLLAGIVTGVVLHASYLAEDHASRLTIEHLELLGELFLRLIKMIIAPLIFTTIVAGMAKHGDGAALARIGGKTLTWFLCASFVSLALGLILVNLLKPGVALQGHLPDPTTSLDIAKGSLSLKQFLYHLFPVSFFEAMAKNEILGVVLFSCLFGVATVALGEQGTILVRLCEAAAEVILKMTSYILVLTPAAVFGAMAAMTAKQGPGILGTYLVFVLEFYLGLLCLWAILLGAGGCVIGRRRVFALLKHIQAPIGIAFATASSEAAYQPTIKALEKFGCKQTISGFILALGLTMNLDGSMMFMSFASLFICQAYGIQLPLATQITMLLVLMVTSKGIAGVPRASLVVIAGTLATFGIPEAGLALLLGIDPILDMGRSATNVVGNSIATAVVSRWEGALDPPHDQSRAHCSPACPEPHGSPPA